MADKINNDEDNVEGRSSNSIKYERDKDQHVEQDDYEVAAPSDMALRNVDLTAVNDTAAVVQAVVARCNQAFDGARAIADVMAPYQETISKVNDALFRIQMPQLAYPNELMEQVSKTARLFSDKMASAISASMHFQDYADTVFESLRPSLEVIQKTLAKLDTSGLWGKWCDAAEKWGDLGWVILDEMPINILLSCPDTYPEANRICRQMALKQLERLRRDLTSTVRKKADVIEMFELYDAKQYKACAMMACSLIEGEFVNWKIARTGNRMVSGSPKGLIAIDNEYAAQTVAVNLSNVIAAHRHFFQSGNGFDRKREGELNRNFLMHGMMYKKVTKIACIKLFLLLDKVTKILPLCDYS